MKCTVCKKKAPISEELWGKCPACAKIWLERLAIPHSWTDAITPTIVEFAGIETLYHEIITNIRDRKLHKARMQGKFIPEMVK